MNRLHRTIRKQDLPPIRRGDNLFHRYVEIVYENGTVNVGSINMSFIEYSPLKSREQEAKKR